jgi:hypothetical protein
MTLHQSALVRAAKTLETGVRHLSRPVRDAVANWRFASGGKRFLVVRHRVTLPGYYRHLLSWLAKELPEVRSRFELHTLPCRISDWSRYVLMVPWFPDPLMHASKSAYRRAKALEERCRDRGIPVINPVDAILRVSKSECARQLARLGIRVPRIEPIRDLTAFQRNLGGMRPPLLVREDLAHAGRIPAFPIEKTADVGRPIEKTADVGRIPLESFEHPIAVEFIDVRSAHDGLYRKYRYFAAGDDGFAHTLQISRSWEVRSTNRLLNAATRAEELRFMSGPDPNHGQLQRALRVLGLDVAAVDYSYDREGRLVVWEVNVLPGIDFPPDPRRRYMFPTIERSILTTVKMYLERAGVPLPAKLRQRLARLRLREAPSPAAATLSAAH